MANIKDTVTEQLQQLQMLQHRSMFAQMGHPFSPRRGQGRILAILRLKPEISQKELTYLLNMSKQAVAELIAKLEKNGLLTRTPSDSDKRSLTIRLTEAGQSAAEQVEERLQSNTQVLDCLNEEELATFSGYLQRLIQQYEAFFPEEDYEARREEMARFVHLHGPGRGPGFGPGPGCEPPRPGFGPGADAAWGPDGPDPDWAGRGPGCHHGHGGHGHGGHEGCGHGKHGGKGHGGHEGCCGHGEHGGKGHGGQEGCGHDEHDDHGPGEPGNNPPALDNKSGKQAPENN
ncbi:MAG: MarR family transcriptional regulator [Oscillospiraceae bacterium]|nr:MarR family transcriptional regulator [Oscillospiraceae bacterium]MDD4368995.1 MarR family transcriptional regulator [Oscillospiraceae bacterium]